MLSRVFCRNFSIKKEAVAQVSEIIVKKPVGSTQTIQGWAASVRKMGKVIFVDVSDGSSLTPLQVVFSKEKLKTKIQNGSSMLITGTLQTSDRGQLELHAEETKIIGLFDVSDNYPFNLKYKQSYDHYRQYLHFRPKIKYFTSLMRFRSAATLTIHEYFNKNGFTLIHTPVLTSSDCEGAAETFMIKPQSQELIDSMKKENSSNDTAFFDSPAYLTVSGQLHLEAIARSIAKVYTFNPSFRAENSASRLHLSEFYMVEAEEAFVTDLETLLQRIEDCVKQVMSDLLSDHSHEIQYMLEHNETDSSQHLKMLEDTIKEPFAVMTFSEAKDLIKKNSENFKDSQLAPFNLSKAEEIFLVKYNNNLPVFIVDWPENEKPFYMKKCSHNCNVVKGVDLLVPNVGELCGGSLREDNYDALKQKLIEKNILGSLQWYLDLRKFGNVPTGGFGMGFERFLQFLLNVQSIKDTIPFPRWPHHLQL